MESRLAFSTFFLNDVAHMQLSGLI